MTKLATLVGRPLKERLGLKEFEALVISLCNPVTGLHPLNALHQTRIQGVLTRGGINQQQYGSAISVM